MKKLTGPALCILTMLVILYEWGLDAAWLIWAKGLALLFVLAILTPTVRRGRQAFVVVAILLSVVLILTQSDWAQVIERAIGTAAFIAAFFCALATLQYAAGQARSVRVAGRFLAAQPPGRRYLALTFGAQLFSTLLNYGSMSLLGNLATSNAASEPDPVIRAHRTRRMLIAIQRGFCSVLTWSPLSFAIPVTTSLVAGVSWGDIVLPGLISSLIIAGTGLALDMIFKPRLANPPPPRQIEGDWSVMMPLVGLFVALFSVVALLYTMTGIRIVGLVLLIVPCISFIWLVLQRREDSALPPLPQQITRFATETLPAYKGEIILLTMAGYIGTVGAPLLGPLLGDFGQSLASLPPMVVLIIVMWLLPLGGQLGMNPILVATLMIPLLPSPEALGVSPAALVLALTAGWALSGATSPFTATTVLIGSMGGVSPLHVGLRWNGAYALLTGGVLSLWVILFNTLTT